MRKRVLGRRFKRDTKERKALFKSLISSLILHERIETTEAKAKTIKSLAEKVITKAKKEKEKAGQFVSEYVAEGALEKLIKDIAPRFSQNQGGYTRIIRLGRRVSDNASVVYLEFTQMSKAVVVPKQEVSKKTKVTRITKEEKPKTTRVRKDRSKLKENKKSSK